MTDRDPRPKEELAQILEDRLRRFRPLILLSPPRGASSVFATALGRSSAFQTYIHEPCGLYSYEDVTIAAILDALEDLDPATLIKEMTFQMQDPRVAEAFLRCCRAPIIFLVRSPLLTIESRVRLVLTDAINAPDTAPEDREIIAAAIERRRYADLDRLVTEEVFPAYRTGWLDLGDQLRFCRQASIDHLVVETSDFRQDPQGMLEALCPRLGIELEPQMLSWEPGTAQLPGALERHRAWYQRVKKSTGIEPPDPRSPAAEHLPQRFQAHLPEAMAVYESSLSDPATTLRVTS